MEVIGYKNHIAAAGESFDSLALSYYDNEFMADKLMKLNPLYVNVIIFKGGENLTIPIYDDIESKETLAPWRR